jgi:hypothetical protein
MIITSRMRKALRTYLPGDYRLVIKRRLEAQGITVHPNTVANVLNGAKNVAVALELVKLANEIKADQKQFEAQVQKLQPTTK